jgi:hypothetical protein
MLGKVRLAGSQAFMSVISGVKPGQFPQLLSPDPGWRCILQRFVDTTILESKNSSISLSGFPPAAEYLAVQSWFPADQRLSS